MGCKRKDPLLSTRKRVSSINGRYVVWVEPCLTFGCNDRMSGIRLFVDWSWAVCFRGSCFTQFARLQWRHCSKPVSNQRKKMYSSEISPSRAYLAAESAAKLPLIPTWPWTETKTSSFPYRIKQFVIFFFFLSEWNHHISCYKKPEEMTKSLIKPGNHFRMVDVSES